MTNWKQLRNLRKLLPLALVLLAFSNACSALWDVRVRGDLVEVSPGKVLPQGHDDYLGTPDAQVKVEFSRAIILEQTLGDLRFNVTVGTSKQNIALYIPPEFTMSLSPRYVWTSITNDYGAIEVSKCGDWNSIAPSWWMISIRGTLPARSSSIIRVFNVTAPSIVGQYFFKVYIAGHSIGARNFPTVVVSADANPAYVSGTVLDGSLEPSRYGRPVHLRASEGGRVVAEGFTFDGRRVIAQAFFNSNASGRYTLYGLAPGTYQLTASAAGYSNTTSPEPITVTRGQSLDGVNIFVIPSPRLDGTVWSKFNGLLYPWEAIDSHFAPGDGAAIVYGGSDLVYALRGLGRSEFFQYNIGTGKWNNLPSEMLDYAGPGAALVFDGLRYIYAFAGGGSEGFYSYDTQEDPPHGSWETMEYTPSPVGAGGSLAFDGVQYIYAFRGNSTTEFRRYDTESELSWDSDLADTPGPVNAGGALASDGTYVYGLAGGNTNNFWKYDPSTDSWAVLAHTPGPVGAGGSLVFDGVQDFYALAGGNTNNFWKYDPSTDTWMSVAPTPAPVGGGGSLTFNQDEDELYALRGNGHRDFWTYDPSANTWTPLASFPFNYARPISIEILDSAGNSEFLLTNVTDPELSRFNFTYDGVTQLDGHIPQNDSGYVSGINTGTYRISVWANQYVQPTVVFVQLVSDGDARIELDVERSGQVEVLVHFKNFLPLIEATPVDSDQHVTVDLYGSDGMLAAENETDVAKGDLSCLVTLTGFLDSGYDYGLLNDTYDIKVQTETERSEVEYYQATTNNVTLGQGNATSLVSLALVRTGLLQVTIRSVDSEYPPVPRNWRYRSALIRVEFRDPSGVNVLYSDYAYQDPKARSVRLAVAGLDTGTYSIYIFTYGYVQTSFPLVFVRVGISSDIAVDVVQGSVLDLTLVLEKEGVLTFIDTYSFSRSVPVRIQILDAYGQFVGANVTHVLSTARAFSFRLAGFKGYYGNYSDWRWVNYYDTTYGIHQRDCGLGPGFYTVRVFLPGFSSAMTATAVLPAGGDASVILHLDRLANVTGNIYSFNMWGDLVPLNWVTVRAIGESTFDFTFTLDGSFNMWLPEGNYLMVYSLNGYESATQEVSLPNGSNVSIEMYLTPL